MKKIIEVAKFFIFLALAFVLLYFAFKGMDFAKLLESLKNANYWWILLSVFFSLVAYVSRAIRWKMLIEPLGYNLSSLRSFYALMIGYAANFVFPRIGEITRCATLTKSDNIPIDKLIGTVIIERACDFIVLVLLLIFIFVYKINFFGKFLNENIFHPITHKLSSIFNITPFKIIALCVISSIIIVLVFLYRKKLAQNKIIAKVIHFTTGIVSGFKSILHMKNLTMFLFHTVLIWTMYFLMTYMSFFAIQATSNLSPIDAIFILVFSGLGMSAPVQGGIGAYHWIVSLGLTLYGINREDGLVFATLSHASQAIFSIFLGVISLIAIFMINKKSKLDYNNKIN